jgi:hypothetical protein
VDIDSVLNPAFSIASTPGAYAVLIGAGISKSSGVPSAWDLQVDLIRRVAKVVGTQVDGNEEEWWRTWSGVDPTYSDVIERLAPEPHERQALLREMFEPSESERDAGLKTPTPAHRAIADLVASGHIRVILTTNFDLLMERAIRDVGIEPYVVSDGDAARGLPPLHTLPALIFHLHGDYLNPSTMLNTANELEKYRPEVADLLGAIVENYGLVVAGWSATWDPALRGALHARARRFYTPVWIEPFDLGELGERLRVALGATLIRADADTAVVALSEAVASLANRHSRHPEVPATAVSMAKRVLSGRSNLVDLHDLITSEFDRLRAEVDLDPEEIARPRRPVEAIEESIATASAVPAALVAATLYWGDATTDRWWFEELERFSRQSRGGGLTRLLRVRRVAGSRLFYSAGVAAVMSSRFDLLAKLLTSWVTQETGTSDERLTRLLRIWNSSSVFDELRPIFEKHLALGFERYQDAWERFELLIMVAELLDNPALKKLAAREATIDADVAGQRLPDHELQSAIQDLSGRVDARQRHIRAQDRMPKWSSVTARRLIADLERDRERHPFAEHLADWRTLRLATEIVDNAIGQVASEVAWSQLPPGGGTVPSSVWLDDPS